MKPRVCIFLDGNNFYSVLKRNHRPPRTDYYALARALAGPGRDLIRTYYYNAVFDPIAFPDKHREQQGFLEALARTPYLEMRLGRIVASREGGALVKGTDVQMGSEMVYYAARDVYDTAVVVTEDSNFAPAVRQVKEMGKSVEVVMFSDTKFSEIHREADRLVRLDDVWRPSEVAGVPEPEEKQPSHVENRSGILENLFDGPGKGRLGLRRVFGFFQDPERG